jgi:hypothetical protein
MADRAERARRRALQDPPKAQPRRKEAPRKPTIEELCEQHGLEPKYSFALCALAKNQSVISHKKNGLCSCPTDPKVLICKVCCGKCYKRSNYVGRLECVVPSTDDQPSIVTPTDRLAKLQAQDKITNALVEEEGMDEEEEECLDSLTPRTLKEVAKFIGLSDNDIRNIPGQHNVSLPTAAKSFHESKDTARLVNAIAKNCDKIIDIRSGKSPQNVIADYEMQVAEILMKRAQRRLMQTPRKRVGRPKSIDVDLPAVVTPDSREGDTMTQDVDLPVVVTPDSREGDTMTQDAETEPFERLLEVAGSDDDSSSTESQERSQVPDDPVKAVEEEIDNAAYRRLVSCLLKIFEAHRNNRRSTIFRTVRAVMVAGIKPKLLLKLHDEKGRWIGQKSRVKGKEDYNSAVAGSALLPSSLTRKKIGDHLLQFALKCMHA